jgi:hypothetical protein
VAVDVRRADRRPHVHRQLDPDHGPAFSAQPFDPEKVARMPVGTGTLTFADTDSGTFTYRVNGLQQTKSLVRFSFGPAPACVPMPMPDYAAAANYQGLWWIAAGAESGWGSTSPIRAM